MSSPLDIPISNTHAATATSRGVLEQLDGVIDRLFGAGLVLANAVRLQNANDDASARLRDVISEIDCAISEVRAAALGGLLPGDNGSFVPTAGAAAGSVPARRCLRRFGDATVVAYAIRGNQFFRASDDMLWARERGDLLVASRSGAPVARRVGSVFYDIESDLPMYYEGDEAPPHLELEGSATLIDLSAASG